MQSEITSFMIFFFCIYKKAERSPLSYCQIYGVFLTIIKEVIVFIEEILTNK